MRFDAQGLTREKVTSTIVPAPYAIGQLQARCKWAGNFEWIDFV